MNCYLPEALHPQRVYTTDDLWQAERERTILSATATMCDEQHRLHVDLGCCEGVIAREDAVLSMGGSETRDIAILSRVGKRVCFHVTGFLPDGSVALSRRAAQQEALEALFLHKRAGDVICAVVTSLAPFGAFCDAGCGVTALLPRKDLCLTQLTSPDELVSENQQIFAAIRTLDPSTRRITLTMKELLGTWEENAARFSSGQTVTGVVRSIKPYGAFISLTPNLSGLAEPVEGLSVGDAVSVYIKSIQPEKLKIKLCVIAKLNAAAPDVRALRYTQTCGSLSRFRYGTQEYAKLMTIF